MNLHTLDYVILLCEDLAVMKTFYHEILGFPVERDWESWIELRAGSGLLTLRKRGCPYAAVRYRGSISVSSSSL